MTPGINGRIDLAPTVRRAEHWGKLTRIWEQRLALFSVGRLGWGGVLGCGVALVVSAPALAQNRLPLTEPLNPGQQRLDDAEDEATTAPATPAPEWTDSGVMGPEQSSSSPLLMPTPAAADPRFQTPRLPDPLGDAARPPRPDPRNPAATDPPPFDRYRLGPGDGIFVGVQRFPDLSFQATLDLEGNIVLPLAGSLNLAGLTLDQAQEEIRQRYDQYVVDPDVSLTLVALRPVEVTIVGEVPRPGFYPLPAPQLSVALVTAGGASALADLRAIEIQRTLQDGTVLAETVDLFTPLRLGQPIPDLRLQSGDVISVPRLDPTRLDEYDRNLVATSTLAKPEMVVRILNRASGSRGTEARFGAITLRNGGRFLDALAQAGVNPDLAAYHRIAVLRFNPEKGSADTIVVDARAAVQGDLSQNIPLQENDVIVVDRNLLANVTYALNTFTQPFRDVLGFLLFFDSLTNAAESLFRP